MEKKMKQFKLYQTNLVLKIIQVFMMMKIHHMFYIMKSFKIIEKYIKIKVSTKMLFTQKKT